MSVTTGSKVHATVTTRGRVGDETGLLNWLWPRRSNSDCQTQHVGTPHQLPTISKTAKGEKKKREQLLQCARSLHSKCTSYGRPQIRVFSLQNCLACMVVHMLIWRESNCMGQKQKKPKYPCEIHTLGVNTHHVSASQCQLNSQIHRNTGTQHSGPIHYTKT